MGCNGPSRECIRDHIIPALNYPARDEEEIMPSTKELDNPESILVICLSCNSMMLKSKMNAHMESTGHKIAVGKLGIRCYYCCIAYQLHDFDEDLHEKIQSRMRKFTIDKKKAGESGVASKSH